MWDFSTEPEFQAKLDWMDTFVREEVEPLDIVWGRRASEVPDEQLRSVIEPLKQRVREQGLWACHLGPDLGGSGYGQVKLALMNQILGRSPWASTIFGTQAPDTGNAEIIAMFGTEAQKERYLKPLLAGELFSCFSMTEPQAGSDPGLFTTSARLDGDAWVIDGEKFFSSNAKNAAFFIVMAVTDPEAEMRKRMSMLLVPAGLPGITIERNTGTMHEKLGEGNHPLVRYDNVRVPVDSLLGERGGAFAISQARLGGGRVHHAMRTVGQCQRALDMLCERALSRKTRNGTLADKQTVQNYIADSYVELTQFRLYVLYTAWCIDTYHDYKRVRKDIAAIKVLTPQVFHSIVQRAIQVHGALGVSNEMPLGRMWMNAPVLGLQDGPTEVHRQTVARLELKSHSPAPGPWPTEHLVARRAEARAKLGLDLPGEWPSASLPAEVGR